MSNHDRAYDSENEYTNTEVSVVVSSLELEDSSGRRKNMRFVGSLTAVISSEHQTFRTTTINVSSGGVLLHEMIPADFVGKSFDLILIAPRPDGSSQYIMARARALGAPLRSARIQFLKAPVELQETLRGIFHS